MKRLPQLDGIRGLAIGLVLVSHYFACLVQKEGHPISFISRILTITWSGVDLFFVLSGFLITGILIDNRESSNYYYIFYLRRACRILPLYLLLLLSYVLVTSAGLLDPQTYQFLLEQPHPLWSYFTFTQNILMGLSCSFGPHWLAVTWSLAVEEHFYFVLPWIIKRIAGSKLLYLFGILVLSAPILRYVAHPCLAYLHTLCRTDSIFAGACLALFYRNPELMKRAERNYSKLLVWFGVLLAGVIAIIRWLPNFSNPVNHLWFALLFSLLIFISILNPDGTICRIFKSRSVVWLGTRSYSIYLFHQLVSGLFHGYLRGSSPSIVSFSDAGVTFLALVATLGLAEVSFRWIESPFMRFANLSSYQRPN